MRASGQRVSGSFRDPSGFVFEHEGRILRAIDQSCHSALSDLQQSGHLDRLVNDGKIVGTRFISDPALLAELETRHPGFQHFLEHDRLETITFPYEWSISMLADAAALTLDLQISLLQQGLSLKDATAYNIQFRNGRPVFIDLSSIERPRRMDLWFALGQFQRHFLFPLLLTRFRGWDLRSYFLANLDGLSPQQVAAAFPGFSRWSPRLLLDVTLPLLLEKKAQSSDSSKSWEQQKAGGDSKAQIVNLNRLRSKVRDLGTGYKTSSTWHDYTATCNYDSDAESAKKQLIERFLQENKPARVLDVGCNTGDYAYLAARTGAQVVAADADHDAVELLHRRLQKEPAAINPVVLNAANPSPAIGFMNEERPAFLERVQADCVFALALIHHLLVSANLPLTGIRDLFHAVTREHLVLEWVPVEDPQFQRLIRFRENLFGQLNLEKCLEVFAERFDLKSQHPVADTGRTLLFFRRKN